MFILHRNDIVLLDNNVVGLSVCIRIFFFLVLLIIVLTNRTSTELEWLVVLIANKRYNVSSNNVTLD